MRDAWEAGAVVVVGDLPTSRGIINLDWGPRLGSARSKYIRRRTAFTCVRYLRANSLRNLPLPGALIGLSASIPLFANVPL